MISRSILLSYYSKIYFRRCVILGNISNNSCGKRDWENGYLLHQRGMAGHNKWSNIKHIKMAKDHQRSLVFSRLSRIIKQAIITGKSNDPKVNDQLSNAIDAAKRAQMPVAKIESIVKGSDGEKPQIPFLMQLKGPGGCFLIIDMLTDNINRSKQTLKYDISKVGNFVECNAQHAFDYKGTIEVDPKASGVTIDNAIDVAIEVGAEDVVETETEDGMNVLQCEPKAHSQVKNGLLSRGCEIVSAGLTYLPKQPVTLSETDMNAMEKLSALLNERSDIVTFYANIE